MKDKDILSEEFENKVNAMSGNAEQTSNTDRDTHFAGFARSAIDEINGAYSEDEEIIILARRAYDLVGHTIESTEHIDLDRLSTQEHILRIPDMPVLPEKGK